MTTPADDILLPRTPATVRVARVVTVVSGLFVLAVLAVQLSVLLEPGALRIQDDPTLAAMKQQLAGDPGNAALADAVRIRDLTLRERYVETMRLAQSGVALLVLGAVVFLVALHVATSGRWRPSPPGPQPSPGWQKRLTAWNLTAVGVFIVAGGVAAAWGLSRPLAGLNIPEPPDLNLRWPRFRGPGGQGHATPADLPLPFDGRTREGIAWKTRIPLPGQSSPVAWGNYIFLTGATAQQRKVFCYSAATGEELWAVDVPAPPDRADEALDVGFTGYAASTPCTDGERIYAIFTNGDLAAVDVSGQIAWVRHLGLPENTYGHAASLLLADGKLIVPFDQAWLEPWQREDGGEERIARSRLLALDPATGETVWEKPRDVADSWSTPIVIDTPTGPQLITAANPWVIAYRPGDGEELWRAKVLSGDVAPSPVSLDGTVYVTMEAVGLFAIATDGRGDVTDTHVRWSNIEGMFPSIASPLAAKGLILTSDAGGTLQCFDAETGEMLWSESVNQQLSASPCIIGPDGGKVLWIGDDGTFYVHPLGRTYEPPTTASLGENCVTVPVFGGGRVFVRGKRHLYCIGPKAQ